VNDEEARQRRSSQAIPTTILRQWLVANGHYTFAEVHEKDSSLAMIGLRSNEEEGRSGSSG